METRTTSVRRLRESLTTLHNSARLDFDGIAPLDALREQTCAVVDDLRDTGWPPDRVIIAIKRITEDAGFRSTRQSLSASHPLSPRDALITSIIRWSIERYYRLEPLS